MIDDSRVIINLASKEYSKCIEKYLTPKDTYITVSFCEVSGNKTGNERDICQNGPRGDGSVHGRKRN